MANEVSARLQAVRLMHSLQLRERCEIIIVTPPPTL